MKTGQRQEVGEVAVQDDRAGLELPDGLQEDGHRRVLLKREVEDVTVIISKELDVLKLWIRQSLGIAVNAFLAQVFGNLIAP